VYHISPTVYFVNVLWRSLEMHGDGRFGDKSTLGIGDDWRFGGCG